MIGDSRGEQKYGASGRDVRNSVCAIDGKKERGSAVSAVLLTLADAVVRCGGRGW